MREMRTEARQIAEKQQAIANELNEESGKPERRTLDGSGKNEQLAKQFEEQTGKVGKLKEDMKRVSGQAEAAEPLLARELYDTLRKESHADTERTLQMTKTLAERGYQSQAQKFEEKARQGIEDLKSGVERAAESVLGDEAEALRQARQELDKLHDQLNQEIAQNAPQLAANQPGQAGQSAARADPQRNDVPPGSPRENAQEGQDGQSAARQDRRRIRVVHGEGARQSDAQQNQTSQRDGQQAQNQPQQQGERNGQRQGDGQTASNERTPEQNQTAENQARQGEGQNSSGQREGYRQAQAQQQGRQQGQQGQQGQSGSQAQASGQRGGEQPGGQNSESAQASSQNGGEGGDNNSNTERDPRRANDRSEPQTLRNLANQAPLRRGGIRSGSNNRGGDSGGGGEDQAGPLTGERFVEWSDRLRNVEEMLDDPALRTEVARVRELAKGVRSEFKRHSVPPNWDMVQTKISAPLAELRDRVTEELARRESKDNLVPIDRDPVPSKYADRVRRYYEELGRSQE
jgi:hypothetical protein